MGNPSDPPEDFVVEKLAEAARDPRNHGYSKSNGIPNLRREVAIEILQAVRRAARSRRGSDRLPRLEGRLQPHVPGDDGPRRHGDRARAILPDPRLFRRARLGQRDRVEVRDHDKFLSNIAYTCEHLYPRPKVVILNYPHNPSTACVEQPFFDEIVKLARAIRLRR